MEHIMKKFLIIILLSSTTQLIQTKWICPGKKMGNITTKAFKQFETEQEARTYCQDAAYEADGTLNTSKTA
jgi:hypothetical protein